MTPLAGDCVSHPADMETLNMSKRERERITVMTGVKQGRVTLVQASQLLDLGNRQTKRV